MKYLITGITGTLGQAVCKILLEDPKNEVLGISRDEQKQRALPPHPRLKLALADVRDLHRMANLSHGIDLIFHFAALKCVDTLEKNPEESVDTNIQGTRNILCLQGGLKIPRVVLSSTDKACYPINVYGQSKAIAEKLVLQNPHNVVCRYGNVIASRGSVIPLFVKSLREEKKIHLTHPKMTRFFLPIEQAAQFVVDQSLAPSGGLKIPEMKSAFITQIAQALAEILDISDYETILSGLRPGEKIHECLRTQFEFEGEECFSHPGPHFTHKELIQLLTPVVRAL